MKTATIDDLAYLISRAKEEGLPNPIVFLGAGASKTGGIPLAAEIETDILERYKNSPKIKSLKDNEQTYAKLMECLTPYERNRLLKEYIDQAKINVTHIYLAQFIHLGYIDYVLTVNFDNLMLRALALFNEFPPTYDMAILKDLTTTRFKEKSVVYLHGQHHGLWLLNTAEEMKKVSEIVPPILHSIKDQRPWIFIGYSGQDPIFDHIVNLGRFDNGLYWVAYNDNHPNESICEKLLKKPNTNAYLIKGYDADLFMLKLNSKLGLPQPLIIDKPFTSLKNYIENIVDIEDKEHFKDVKIRLQIVKNQVGQAIQQFEKGKLDFNDDIKLEIDLNLLKKQIINHLLKGQYDEVEINLLKDKAESLNNPEINVLLADLFNIWGITLKNLAESKKDETLYEQSIEKYHKATSLNPKDANIFNNWGLAISELAKLKKDETLYQLSFEKYHKATSLNPLEATAFGNWGLAVSELAQLKKDEALYKQSFEKYKKAIGLNPKYTKALSNWGTAILELAQLRKDETLYKQSFEKYQEATILNPQDVIAFCNWGVALSDLAQLKKDGALYEQSFEKFLRATELNPKYDAAFNNWGVAISGLAQIKNDKKLHLQSIKKYKKAINLNPNFDAAFNNWGLEISTLAKLNNDKTLYLQSIEKYKKATDLNPKYDAAYCNWGLAIYELAKLKNDEALYIQSIEKYKKATDLNPKYDVAYCNWGLALFELAKLKNDEALYIQSIEKYKKATDLNPAYGVAFNNWGATILSWVKLKKYKDKENLLNKAILITLKAVKLGGSAYNLACTYALKNNKSQAFKVLENCLKNKEIKANLVECDEDWQAFLGDTDFIQLIQKYKEADIP